MPALNKQTLINLLIDSPLREPIKINLIDIINNTSPADLGKIYPTIRKELEIYQKATNRRLKLAEKALAKLSDNSSSPEAAPEPTSPPELKTPPSSPAPPPPPPAPPTPPPPDTGLKVPPLDLPPLPQTKTQPTPPNKPLSPPPPSPKPPEKADETALKEIQQELDALKNDAAAAATPAQPNSTS